MHLSLFKYRSRLKRDKAECDRANVIPRKIFDYFSWRKENGSGMLGPGLALVFYDGGHKNVAAEFTDVFRNNLGLETEPDHSIAEMGSHLARGIYINHCNVLEIIFQSVVRLTLEDEGALIVCVLTQLSIDEESGIILPLYGGQNLSSVTGKFSGANCPRMVGKPKIFLFLDLNQREDAPKMVRQFSS
jgi:hypothetical protein